MAEITIIPSVRLYKTGLKTTQADGNTRSIALRQGSLDGACAVYSTIIALMCLRQINYEDVDTSNGNIDKRSPKGRFLSMLLEQRGMNMQGWNLKTLAQEINNTSDFGIKATAIKKDYIDRIYDNTHEDLPSIIGLSFRNNEFGHAIVCIGVEESEECENKPVKLLCIDPAYPMACTAYWNCVIILPKNYDDDTYLVYSTDEEKTNVLINDAIIFI